MLHSVSDFADYFDNIRRRTLLYLRCVPPDQFDWAPRPGEYSCADIARHLAAAEQMFVGAVVDGVWRYAGHASGVPTTLDQLIAELDRGHAAASARLRALPDAQLLEARPTLDGPPVKAWRLLMAMVEHEVHHRSQLAMYLLLLGVQPSHIYGLGVEDVIARATT